MRLGVYGLASAGCDTGWLVGSEADAPRYIRNAKNNAKTIDMTVLIIPMIKPAKLRPRLRVLRARATLARMIAGIPVINPRPVNETAPRIMAAMASGSSDCGEGVRGIGVGMQLV
jgi:hypothetical protein